MDNQTVATLAGLLAIHHQRALDIRRFNIIEGDVVAPEVHELKHLQWYLQMPLGDQLKWGPALYQVLAENAAEIRKLAMQAEDDEENASELLDKARKLEQEMQAAAEILGMMDATG